MDAPTGAERPDFFISYSNADKRWAEWIAWHLERADYVVVIQEWDFPGGTDFISKWLDATRPPTRTIGVLTPSYLKSKYAMAEFAHAFARDPQRAFVGVRVEDYDLDSLPRSASFVDLMGVDDAADALDLLLTGLRMTGERPPRQEPAFPPGTNAAAGAQTVLSRPEYPQVLPKRFRIPLHQDPNFAGRDELMSELHNRLRAAGSHWPAHVITGLPGVGKSSIVMEYAYRNREQYDVVWWVNAAEPTILRHDYAALAIELALAAPDARQEDLVAAAKLWLETHGRWLMIFDNADNAENVEAVVDLLPRSDHGDVLVTARYQAGWDDHGRVLECKPLTDPEAARLLLHLSGSDDEGAASALGPKLGSLPLALKQAAALVNQSPVMTLKGYLEQLQTRESKLLRGGEVKATMNLTLEQVRSASGVAGDLLNLLAFLPSDEIPLALLAGGRDVLPRRLSATVADPLDLASAIGILYSYCVVSTSGDAIVVNPMVQLVVRDRLRGRSKQWAAAAVRLVDGVFPAEGRDVARWPDCARLLAHAHVTSQHAQDLGAEPEVTIRLLVKMATYLQSRADLPAAAALLERAVSIARTTYEGNDLRVTRILEPLGFVLREMGDVAGGRAKLVDTLAVYERVYGPLSLEVAEVLVKLGFSLWDSPDTQSKESSRAQFERALDIYARIVPAADSLVAVALSGLGQVLSDLGDLGEAIRCQQRALDTFRANHEELEVARTLDKLGFVLRKAGRYGEAREAHEGAIELYAAHYDDPHPEMAMAYTNLGRLLGESGLAEARAAHERALAILTATLPPGHWYIGLAERRLARASAAAALVESDDHFHGVDNPSHP